MYLALKRLRFGQDTIWPGERVPEEPGRNYEYLLRSEQIKEVPEKDLLERAQQAAVTAERERDEALAQLRHEPDEADSAPAAPKRQVRKKAPKPATA